MRDYIAEANHFMYDDSYITEAKVAVDGKKYASKKAAEEDLKKKGLKGKQVADKMAHSHEYTSFVGDPHDKEFNKTLRSHGITKHQLDKNDENVWTLRGSKKALQKIHNDHFITGDKDEDDRALNSIKAIKKKKEEKPKSQIVYKNMFGHSMDIHEYESVKNDMQKQAAHRAKEKFGYDKNAHDKLHDKMKKEADNHQIHSKEDIKELGNHQRKLLKALKSYST